VGADSSTVAVPLNRSPELKRGPHLKTKVIFLR